MEESLGCGLHKSWNDLCKPVERTFKKKKKKKKMKLFTYFKWRKEWIVTIGGIFHVGVRATWVKVDMKTKILTSRWLNKPLHLQICKKKLKQAYTNPATK